MTPTIDDKIDQFEAAMLSGYPLANCPLQHLFLPGVYIRTIMMGQNTWVTSLVHNTVHGFVIRKGRVSVYNELMGEEIFEIGYMGVTTPGTRRILFNHEETWWATVHPLPFITGQENSLSDEEKLALVDRITDMITEEHVNPLIGGVVKNNIITKSLADE